MIINTLITLFERDLNKLIAELSLYQDEKNIWRTDKQITNSAGNLALHLVGNLNTYIGKELGNSGYIRNRELEFSQKDVQRVELIEKISETLRIVKQTLSTIQPDDLAKEYPILVFAEKTSTEYLLVHLATHLGYHLGQVNYHRRLLDN